MKSPFLASLLLAATVALPLHAWDYEGHRTVNLLALASLPTNFPAALRDTAAQERIGFLAGEPDRWRNTSDRPLRHLNGLDHYFDMEYLADYYAMSATNLSPFRYEFTAQMATIRARHPEKFPADEKDSDRIKYLPGFLPWAIMENYSKLKSGFSYLKVFEEMGTPEEVAQARQNLIYIMGVMGHYVGDATQPLHTTKHFNGWVGANPKGYATNKTFHSWIDGGYLRKAGGLKDADLRAKLRPATNLNTLAGGNDDVFPLLMRFIAEQHKLVEPLYEMNKDGRLSGNGEKGMEAFPVLSSQISLAAQLLGDLWLTAYQNAPVDNFLKNQLATRKLQADAKDGKGDEKPKTTKKKK
ncbi:MAG: hypothetical protein HZA92_08325 [Verrucomicrobia bacterium]|nr:hypothetical protein [Verrucomicrobiota bacterium]